MDYLEEMQNGEVELRKSEGRAKKLGPPPGMDDQAWKIDQYYLQYMLRMKARKCHYKLWARVENIQLKDVDFAAMEELLLYRKDLIKKDPLLKAFLHTIELLELDPSDSSTPAEFERTLIRVVNSRQNLGVEDYVYLTTYLAAYATTAHNKKQGDYAGLMFISQIPALEAKYGMSWREGDQHLSYVLLYNLAVTAMNLAEKEPWRGLTMDLVKGIGEEGTVYDWVEELLKAYESRLEPKHRQPTLAFIRARSAFFQTNYPEAAKQLMLIGISKFNFFGLGIRQLRLMTYYELLYCHGKESKPLARGLEPDAKKTIREMRDHLKDLDIRQKRKTFQLEHYLNLVNNFSELLTLTEHAGRLPEDSNQRFQYLFQPRAKLIKQLEGKKLFAEKWLRRKFKELK